MLLEFARALYCFALLLQVCEERLQFSLSENVKTNVLWGTTIKDTAMLRTWGEEVTGSSGDLVTVKEQREDERYGCCRIKTLATDYSV